MGWELDYTLAKECGCIFGYFSDDWLRHKCRIKKRCEQCALFAEHNKKVDHKQSLIKEYIKSQRDLFEAALDKKMGQIPLEPVAIKYYYEVFNVAKSKHVFKYVDDSEVRRFRIEKKGARYFCCKARVDYYVSRPPQDRFIEVGLEAEVWEKYGWTESDFIR